MKLDAGRLAVALGGTTAILWVVCSALVALFAGPMMMMSGHMIHMEVTGAGFTMTIAGFLIGLVVWSAIAAIAGWLIARIYNAAGATETGGPAKAG